MITSLHVDNFKALNDVTIEFSPFTVLIGDNSAGKATVLQALAFLKYCCTASMDKFLDERHMTVADIGSKFSAKKDLSFSVRLRLHGEDITWDLSIAKGKDRLSLSSERILLNKSEILSYGRGKDFRLNERTGRKDPIMAGSYNNSIIGFTDTERQADVYPTLTALKCFFTHMAAPGLLSPESMRDGRQGTAGSFGLGGEKLGSLIKSLSEREREELARDVQRFLPFFSAVLPKATRLGQVRLEVQETYGDRTIHVSPANISDGVLRIIALCSLRFLNNDGGAVLLNEIEDGINNEHMELLVDTLRRAQSERNVQIIATTHSTLLLDDWVDRQDIAAGPDPTGKSTSSVVFLYRDPTGQVTAQNIFSSPHIRERLRHMFPGEIILNMSNKEIREMLSGGDTR